MHSDFHLEGMFFVVDTLFNFFSFGGTTFALFIISMIPIVELRGAVILGAALQMDWSLVFIVCVIGNILPIPFILAFGKKLIHWLKTLPLFKGLTTRYETRLLSKAHQVEKYSAIGLCLFVAIPLPGTGAWSGAILAALLDMRIRHALPAIALGVVIAGVIMTIGSYGLFSIFSSF